MRHHRLLVLLIALPLVFLLAACEPLPEEPGHNNPLDPEYQSHGGGLSLISPSDNSSQDGHVELRWDHVEGATRYRIELSMSGDFSNNEILTEEWGGTEATVYQPQLEPAHASRVFWRVAAYVDNNYNIVSPTWSFTYSVDDAIVSLQRPEDGAEFGNHAWFAWEQVNGAGNYELQVSPNAVFDGTIFSENLDSDELEFLAPANAFNNGQDYHWRVRAFFGGNPEEWSAPSRFTFNLSAAVGTPDPLAPGNEEVVDGTTVNLDWSSVAGAEAYRLQIADDGQVEFPMRDEIFTDTDASFAGSEFNLGTSYFWRVAAIGPGGSLGEWTTIRSFTYGSTGGNLDPPMLNDPYDGEVRFDDVVSFTWTSVASATDYQIQVSEDQVFSSIVYQNTTTSTWLDVDASSMSGGGVRYWRMRSVESGTPGNWSGSLEFFNYPPGASIGTPQQQLPGDGVTVTSSDVTLEWSSVTTAGGYGVQVSDDASWDGPLLSRHTTATQITIPDDGSLTSGTTYQWRVTAIGISQRHASWSSVRSFTYSPGGGSGPTVDLLVPSQGASVSGSVYFEWSGQTDGGNLDDYRLQVSGSSGFESFAYNQTQGAGTSITLAGTHFPNAQQYYWRVVMFVDSTPYTSAVRSFNWSP